MAAEFAQAIKGLKPRQRAVMHRIACGDDAMIHDATAAVLIRRGLIEMREQTLGGRFPVKIKRYDMPLHVHIPWAYWCSEHPEEDDAMKKIDSAGAREAGGE